MLLQANRRTILEKLWFIHSQRIDGYTQKEIRGSSCLLAIYKSKIMRGLFWIETIKRTGRAANIDYFFPWSKRHKICIISQELTNMSTILLCLLFLNKKTFHFRQGNNYEGLFWIETKKTGLDNIDYHFFCEVNVIKYA